MLIEVENDDGTWSVLNRANHGQNLQEVMLMARWRATQMLGTARIRRGMPSAAITQLLRSPSALPRPQMAPAAPPTASPAPDIAALLAMLGLGPPRQVEPPTPVAPVPRQPSRSREAEDLIGKALQDPMSNERPLFLSADQLDELDIDTEDLAISLAHLQLHAAENFDAQGGVLVARSRNLLEAAERLKRGFRPVPFVPVMPARRESG